MPDLKQNILIDESVSPDQRKAVEFYIERLQSKGMPIILSEQHFSTLVGVDLDKLYAISNSPQSFYRKFRLKKKNGGHRTISAPLPFLLNIQQWILRNILERLPVHATAKAYKKKSSIKESARFHRGQRYLFKTDVEKFFDSIKAYWVFNFFREIGYTSSLSRLFAGICCIENALPQGASTSGLLSNIYMVDFDDFLYKYCRERQLRYTRYADDIAISGSEISYEQLVLFIKVNLNSIGLRINFKKTKMYTKNNRQIVTGIVVNDKMAPERGFRKKIRQEMYYIEKYGLHGHCRILGEKSVLIYVSKLIGRVSFVRYVIGKNKEFDYYTTILEKIAREIV